MPIYEYECPECGVVSRRDPFSIHAKPDVHCPSHGLMKKIISAPAPPQFGGVSGKLRTGEQIQKRNDAYWKTSQGKERRREELKQTKKRVGTL